MFFHPSAILFFCFLLVSMFMMICMNSWFLIWFFIEMNLLCFIPLILLKKNKYSVESSLKYFFVQALSSVLILSGILLMFMNFDLYDWLFISGLSIKLGFAPFHQWMVNIVEGLDWGLVLILLTLQKVGPFILFYYMYTMKDSTNYALHIISIMCALVGAMGGLFTSSLRKIMVFSSVSHSAWMILGLVSSIYLWLMYFIFYSLILFSVLFMFKYLNMSNLNHMFMKLSFVISLSVGVSLLSMGGMPPLSGFIPKFILLSEFILMFNYFMFFVLLTSVFVSLFFYSRIFILNFIFLNYKNTFLKNKNVGVSVSLYVNLMGVLVTPFLIYLN
uniref:NADH-ubiquinone oxidoreductase chain 2 n=1 Tax=Metacrangonyx dominicanus TaxID=1199168 RepID=K7ZWI7_9CRUS|nr:NADH dehydrogenase subunit 2 [Metacrangonyx dominicanus]CCI69355.1 NADH dehydrogenase subunit 2 [Metacrangonyx dominicanus]